MARLIVAAFAVLLLVGCGANTDDAYARCVDAQAELWKLEHPDATVDEFTDQLALYADGCQEAAQADPAKFNEIWSR